MQYIIPVLLMKTITMKGMIIEMIGMTEIVIIQDTMVDDMIEGMNTSTRKEDCKGEFKTMEIKKTVHVDPFNATHASMKDIDMQNVLTKIEHT